MSVRVCVCVCVLLILPGGLQCRVCMMTYLGFTYTYTRQSLSASSAVVSNVDLIY